MTALVTSITGVISSLEKNSKIKSNNHVEQQQKKENNSKVCLKSTNISTTMKHSTKINDEKNRLIKINPFLNDFLDCIENLPNRLQIIISELRRVDVQVNGKYF